MIRRGRNHGKMWTAFDRLAGETCSVYVCGSGAGMMTAPPVSTGWLPRRCLRYAEHEAGTIVYAVNAGEGQPLQRIFYELYRDRAAFDAHEERPHVRRFLTARAQYLASVE